MLVMSVYECHVDVGEDRRERERALDPLELELSGFLSHLMWVSGIRLFWKASGLVTFLVL